MQKEEAGLLNVLPQQRSGWPRDGNVRVTVRSSRCGLPSDLTAQRVPLRKSLVALDILCLLVAAIPFLICEINVIPPKRRGFFCNDSSISYPLQRTETISDLVLITVGILIAAPMIILGESCRVHSLPQGSHTTLANPYVVALYKEAGIFLFGCMVSQSLTNMTKVTVGRLRPYFLAVCRPNFTRLNCAEGYLEDYVCAGSASAEREARKSFYSGHASFAMYTMMYLVFYLQARFTWQGARMLRPLVQFVLLVLAIYTGLTRISDYRHHPSDVVVGLLQGAVMAYWVAFHVSGMFQCKHPSSPSLKVIPSLDCHTDC